MSLIADKGRSRSHEFWTALSQYFACESDLAVKIPDSLSWEEAGCIQPLAVAIQVCSPMVGIIYLCDRSWYFS